MAKIERSFAFRSAAVTSVLSVLGWIGIFLLSGCEKEVHIDVDAAPPRLVVNGVIETGQWPAVVLTHSIGYFSTIDLNTLENSFIHGAKVNVSDGLSTIALKEYSIDTGGTNKFYFYTIDTADAASVLFKGTTDRTYRLTIEADGQQYESYTKVPNCRPIDSMKAIAPGVAPANAPTAMQLKVYYSDPDTIGNCIRYFTKRNSEPFYPGLNSVYDDQIVNGTKNAQLPLAAGEPRTGKFTDSTGFVFRGDTVTLRWCAIDRSVFNFYSTFEYALGTVGNPFASPINVQSNVSNGALGIWAGYGVTEKRIVVPK